MFLKFVPVLLLSLPYSAFANLSEGSQPATPVAAAPPANSLPVQYKIRQILPQQKLVIVKATNSTAVASDARFVFTLSDDSQCDLPIKELKEDLITFDSSSCLKASLITLKTEVEPAIVVTTPKPQAAVVGTTEQPLAVSNPSIDRDRMVMIFLGIAHSTMDEFRFNLTTLRDTSGSYVGSGESKFSTSSAEALNVALKIGRRSGWAGMVGAFYEFPREVKSFQYGSSGITYDGMKVSFLGAECNMVYQWETLYLPFGLNYTMPTLQNFVGTVSVVGGAGTQVGVGWRIGQHQALELIAKIISFSIDYYNFDGSRINYGLGTGAGLNLGYKVVF